MHDRIKLEDIYDKNINFLIGAGASYGLFPTLALNIKDEDGTNCTIETLATKFDNEKEKELKTLLFMHYFQSCIKPVMTLNIESLNDETEIKVIENYETFLKTILSILNKKRSPERRCNIFTTNYDGCLALTADKLLSQGKTDFIINDGTRGFKTRYLQSKNFGSFVCQSGVFDQHHTDIPQINLVHLHGSAYWKKIDENITVNYNNTNIALTLDNRVQSILSTFSEQVTSKDSKLSELKDDITILDDLEEVTGAMEDFWSAYNQLPIVNPTKWKFHETVFEEHYYQMLRALSYELEKPNTIFISFGFSFADEHILNLIKRSLSNPSLQLFVCCFNEHEKILMETKFLGHANVQLITTDGFLNFSVFNSKTFTLNSEITAIEEKP
jgi:hypothetical protein